MNENKWTDLQKGRCPNHFSFKIESAYSGCQGQSYNSFSQCAFDANDEALVAIDNNGIAYYVDLSKVPAFRKLGLVGLSTFLSFNPIDRNQLFIGLSSTNIKVLRIHSINDFGLLTGHTAPPTNIAFYKDFFLTASSGEVLIWHLQTFCKAHQLRLNVKHIVIKKATFSNAGLVAVLYQTNVIQVWPFQKFNEDHKIEVQKDGLKIVKDFDFTKDARAMIVCGLQNRILVYNTSRWDLLKTVDLQNFSGGKQLMTVPLPLDGGANSIIAILTSDCLLRFISIASSSILENCCEFQIGIKKIDVSLKGHYLSFITKDGSLDLILLDKVLNIKLSSSSDKSKTTKTTKSSQSSKTEDSLKCLENSLKEELKLQRLLPILREYGEYPEKHRRLIWSTIMELPNNKKAYIDLSNKIPHESMFELLKKDPLLEKCKSSLLATTLSCLLHWCPVLAECAFIPRLIMPFANVFQKSPILAFEASLYILLNYCQKWFEYHPLAPLNILGMIENILLEADPPLFNYFCEKGITSTDYAWPLLQNMLSEVLINSDWLILWDHLLSIRKPWLLLMCVVSYNISYRKTIMSRLHTADDFKQFYRAQGHVSMKNILKIAHKLDCETPHRIHPRRYLNNDIDLIPSRGPYPPFLQYSFPTYLTDEIRGMNMKKIREKERKLRGLQLHALELLEEKRLKMESENFVRNVHEMRLDALRKCYENQVRDDERLLEYTKRKTEDLEPSRYLNDDDDLSWTDLRLSSRKLANLNDYERRRRRRSKSRNRESRLLQEQVDRLELEVQNLLTVLHNKSARSKSRVRLH